MSIKNDYAEWVYSTFAVQDLLERYNKRKEYYDASQKDAMSLKAERAAEKVKIATATFIRNYNIDPEMIKNRQVKNEKELNEYALGVTAPLIIRLIKLHDSYESQLLGMIVSSTIPTKIERATPIEQKSQTPTSRGVAPTEKHIPDRPITKKPHIRPVDKGMYKVIAVVSFGIIALVSGVLIVLKLKKRPNKNKTVLTKTK